MCATGIALTSGCDPCVTQICAVDSYCCTNDWDSACVDEVQSVCGLACAGACGDGVCGAGEDCNTCPGDCGACVVCGDGVCDVTEDCNTCPGDCGACGACAHDKCATGVALTSGCDPCVTQICAVDSYCCTSSWDSVCVDEVLSVCGLSCAGGACAHDKCVTGVALTSGCDPCVTQVCAVDDFCCNTDWDSICVDEVLSVCGLSCP